MEEKHLIPLIEVRGVTKQFKTVKGKFVAIDKLSFIVPQGTVTGFIGPNGSGKTTTIKMMLGLIKPTKGEIWISGNKAGEIKIRECIGYMPEKDSFYPDMYPLEFLVYMAELSGLSKKEARKRAEHLLKFTNLWESRTKKIKGFSSGMKQKLKLCQALIHDPSILLLDEPTAALDPIAQNQFLEIIKKLKKLKKTILISSHQLENLEKIVDWVIIIKNGKLVTQCWINELKTHKHQLEIEVTHPKKVLKLITSKFKVKVKILDNKLIIYHPKLEKIKNKLIQLIINSGEEIKLIQIKKRSLWEATLALLEKEK